LKVPIRTLVLLLATLIAACTATPIQTSSPTLAPPSPTSPATSPSSTVPSPTATPSTTVGTLAERLEATLDDVLRQRRRALDIPGMTAAILFPDGSTWSSSAGVAQVDPELELTVNTPFVAGSITKTFVAATMLQLVEEGALALDDPLSDWLPDYPRADDITLRMLLSHTSGVFNLFESRDYTRLVIREGDGKSWTPQEVLDELVDQPYCAPGECYHYSNTGFVLLGMVIEAETGKSVAQVFSERFFAPLGLEGTYFQSDSAPPDGAARGYVPTADGNRAIDDGTTWRPTQSEATVVFAAGGVVGPVLDICHWGRSLFTGGVLSDESLALLTDYAPHPDGAYGLGTRTREFDGIRMFGHTGALRGYNAAMWHLTTLDLTVCVMTNRTRIDANKITDALLEVALPAVQ
jgi:D-alanyl-D-alanine carboxypeptidase